MLIDLLNSASYIMLNLDAIKILGLTNAAYCAELLTIYKKAVKKKKLYNEKYFKIERDYITERLNLTVEEQLSCDKKLATIDLILIDEENPDLISIDVEKYASLLASEDIKLLDKVSKTVASKTTKQVKFDKRARQISILKDSIECKTFEVLVALKGWIDSIMVNESKFMSVQQVKAFKSKLDDYCDGDLNKALKIIELATIHQYIDCQWAIKLYENNGSFINTNINTTVRTTEQKKTTSLGDELF